MTLVETGQLLGNFGEFVGAFAVVATLFYLASAAIVGNDSMHFGPKHGRKARGPCSVAVALSAELDDGQAD